MSFVSIGLKSTEKNQTLSFNPNLFHIISCKSFGNTT